MSNADRISKWREERRQIAEAAKQERLERAKHRSEIAVSARTEAAEAAEQFEMQVVESRMPSHETVVSEQMAVLRARDLKAASRNRLHLLILGLPVILTMLYAWLFLTPLYEAKSLLAVSSPGQIDTSAAPALLGGVGGVGASDAFKVREFLGSREAMSELETKNGFLESFAKANADYFTRPKEISSFGIDHHDFYKARVRLSVDIQNSLITLRVQATNPAKAVEVSQSLIEMASERLRLWTADIDEDLLASLAENIETTEQAYFDANQTFIEAQKNSAVIDSTRTSDGVYELISSLELDLTTARAQQIELLKKGLIRSPRLPGIETRIDALQTQIKRAQERLSGAEAQSSIRTNAAETESLISQRDLARENYQFAQEVYETARQRTLAQRKYLVVVAAPNEPSVSVFKRNVLYVGLLASLLCAISFIGLKIFQAMNLGKGKA